MSELEDARKNLRDFLQDMDALKPYADPGSPEAQPFRDAFAKARAHAVEAAKRYAQALGA